MKPNSEKGEAIVEGEPLRFRRLCALVALVAAFPCVAAEVGEGAAEAEDAAMDGGVYFGLQAGTLGAGPVLGYDFSERLGVRGQFGWFDYDTDGVGDDYSGSLEFRSGSLLLDWSPLGGAFRLTAGAFANQSEIIAAAGDATVDLGGRPYAGTANLRVGFDSVAPYLGIGWSAGRDDGGLRLLVDVGVLIQGTPARLRVGQRERTRFGHLRLHALERRRREPSAAHYAMLRARRAWSCKRTWPRNIAN